MEYFFDYWMISSFNKFQSNLSTYCSRHLIKIELKEGYGRKKYLVRMLNEVRILNLIFSFFFFCLGFWGFGVLGFFYRWERL